MYGNSGASDPYADAAPAAPTEKPTAEPQEEKGEEATAVIPKALLAGKDFKPGEEIMLEIVQLTEDGAVVKYASDKGGEEEAPPEEAPPPSEMQSMMQ
jgi:hypothetical protein